MLGELPDHVQDDSFDHVEGGRRVLFFPFLPTVTSQWEGLMCT